jgi:transcriptional regulator with XRE-family HTH domain
VKRGDAHQDRIEMSGRRVSAIVTYGVRENGALTLSLQVVFPTMRAQAGLTQRQLAKKVSTTASVICRLEDADYEGHSLAMLRRVAAALGKRIQIRFVPVGKPSRPLAPEAALQYHGERKAAVHRGRPTRSAKQTYFRVTPLQSMR